MTITNAVFADAEETAIRATVDGNSVYITPGGDLWNEAVKVATPYVPPVIDPKVARANALASIGWILEQIKGYEVIGADASEAIAKYKSERAKIDVEYPPEA